MAQLCVKLALCLIIATCVHAAALKSRQISLPPGAIVMDIVLRQKTDDNASKTIATMQIEIDGEDKKVTLFDAAAEMPPDKVIEIDKTPAIGTIMGLDERSIFPKGKCPKGMVRRGNVCFPDDDDM